MQTRFLWTLLLGLAVGCGGGAGGAAAPGAVEKVSLNEVGELYRIYSLTKKKAPTKFADFKSLEQSNPTGYGAVRSGKVVVLYGATMPDPESEEEAKSGSDEVLAYEGKVPESGGQVLMLNRAVKTMSAAEFKAAKKAGKG